MNIAAEARAAALHFECKKDGLSQLQDGSWVLKVKVHPSDVPPALLTAPMGTRFVAALVEIADDETPVPPEQQAERGTPVKERKRWSELPLSQQAAIRCNEPGFRMFLRAPDAGAAARIVRNICEVESRKDIIEGTSAGKQWVGVEWSYQNWLRDRETENA